MSQEVLEAPTNQADEPIFEELPAPLSRALVFVTLALLSGIAVCWCLRRSALPVETGTVDGQATALVSDWTGRVKRVYVAAGDRVEVGQPIAVLIDEQLQQDLARQIQEVTDLKAALKRTEESVDYRLAGELETLDAQIADLRNRIKDDATPELSFQLKVLEFDRLKSANRIRQSLGIDRIRQNLAESEGQLARLQAAERELTLTAPVTGTIRDVLRKAGDRVVSGTPLIEFADQDRPYLVMEMPEPIAKRFALGDKIPISFPGQEESLGKVSDMIPFGTDPGNTSRVRFKIVPAQDDWPQADLKTAVKLRTAESSAMSRRVN